MSSPCVSGDESGVNGGWRHWWGLQGSPAHNAVPGRGPGCSLGQRGGHPTPCTLGWAAACEGGRGLQGWGDWKDGV